MGDTSVIAHKPTMSWGEAREVLNQPVVLDDGRQIVPLQELQRIADKDPQYGGYLQSMRANGVPRDALRPLVVSLQQFLIAEQQQMHEAETMSAAMRGVHQAMSPRQMRRTPMVKLLRDATDSAWRDVHGIAAIANIHPMDILVSSENGATRTLREQDLPELVTRLEETLGADCAKITQTDALRNLVQRINRMAELLQKENTGEQVDGEHIENAYAALHSAIRLVEEWRAERAQH